MSEATVSCLPCIEIKFFEDCKSKTELKSQMEKSIEDFKKTKTTWSLLHLRESLQGNIFNRPFQYISLRNLHEDESKLFQGLDHGDVSTKDKFFTIEKRSSCDEESLHQRQGDHPDFKEKRYVILAYKALDDNNATNLEKNWRHWTGTKELLKRLSTTYQILSVWCLKCINVIPGFFSYIVIIELSINKHKKQCDNYALDCVQKFRLKRMSGYVALYSPVHK